MCIMAWTRFSNVCPLCKIEITFLIKYDQNENILEELKVEKIEKTQEDINDWVEFFAETCYICG